MTPRIALPIPTSTDEPYNQRSVVAYETAIARSGGEPVRIGLGANPSQIREIAATCHGVCLPGSPADVDPALYGEEAIPETSPADKPRESADRILLEDAQKYGKPVLGICYGVQSLNVWLGGSLVQDLTPLPVNHSAGSSVAIAHAALIAEDSVLASLLDASEVIHSEGFVRLPINTSHHQSVASPGHGLRIVARCPDDGVIEAVELDPTQQTHETDAPGPQFLIGVQWHPERSYEISAASRALFDRLILEARRHAV
jgi:putative glutamine amidotransferase